MFFIGDIHGTFETYQHMIGKYTLSTKRYPGASIRMQSSLQIGDFGVFYDKDILTLKMLNIYDLSKHKIIRGNHDNPNLIKLLPNYIGDYKYFSDQDLFVLGGGFSIDYKKRTPGKDWWHDEEISYNDLFQSIELYSDKKPKYVATHVPPILAKNWFFENTRKTKYVSDSRTEQALSQMYDAWQPDVWIFGHVHPLERVEFKLGKTLFVALGGFGIPNGSAKPKDCIYELPEIDW